MILPVRVVKLHEDTKRDGQGKRDVRIDSFLYVASRQVSIQVHTHMILTVVVVVNYVGEKVCMSKYDPRYADGPGYWREKDEIEMKLLLEFAIEEGTA